MKDSKHSSQFNNNGVHSSDSKLDAILDQLKQISSDLEALRTQTEESDRTTRSQLQGVLRVLKASRDCLPSEVSELQALRDDLADKSISMPSLGGWPLGASTTVDICRRIEAGNISGNILELGGGASTVWIAATLRKTGFAGEFWSVDHDRKYLEKTRALLRDHRLERYVNLIHAPISSMSLNGETMQWYSIDEPDNLREIGLLIVDGPPGTTNQEARLPSLYYFADQLHTNAWIYLDDCHRTDEKNTAEKWMRDFPSLVQEAQIGDTRIFHLLKSEDDKE